MSIYIPNQNDIIHETSVDFVLRPCAKEIHIVQYDKSLPIVKVELFKNGERYVLPENAVVNVRVGKLDHTFVYDSILGTNEERNIVYFEISEQMATIPGRIWPVIEVIENSKVACSSPLCFIIECNPIQEGQIESHDDFPIIYELQGMVADHETRITALESQVGGEVVTLHTNQYNIDGEKTFLNNVYFSNPAKLWLYFTATDPNHAVNKGYVDEVVEGIEIRSDVIDIVGTYQDLLNYDTTKVSINDLIKVITDSTHNNAISYYRWEEISGSNQWNYVASEGPFYTISQSDAKFVSKDSYDLISGNKDFSGLTTFTNEITANDGIVIKKERWKIYENSSHLLAVSRWSTSHSDWTQLLSIASSSIQFGIDVQINSNKKLTDGTNSISVAQIVAKYDKPSTGIPASDLAETYVKTYSDTRQLLETNLDLEGFLYVSSNILHDVSDPFVCIQNNSVPESGNQVTLYSSRIVLRTYAPFEEDHTYTYRYPSITGYFVIKDQYITGATKCKITYDSQGLVTSGSDLTSSDIPSLDASKITSGTFADARIASASTWNAKYDKPSTGIPASDLAEKYVSYTLTNNIKHISDSYTFDNDLHLTNLVYNGSNYHDYRIRINGDSLQIERSSTSSGSTVWSSLFKLYSNQLVCNRNLKLSGGSTPILLTDGTNSISVAQIVAKYDKPSGGIPASDLANLDASKITSGTFADARIASASIWNAKYDKPSGGIPASDLAESYVTLTTDQTVTGMKTLTDASKIKFQYQNNQNVIYALVRYESYTMSGQLIFTTSETDQTNEDRILCITTTGVAIRHQLALVGNNTVLTDGTISLTISDIAAKTALSLNGLSSSSTASIYAPTTSGTAGDILVSRGPSIAPEWVAPSYATYGNQIELNANSYSDPQPYVNIYERYYIADEPVLVGSLRGYVNGSDTDGYGAELYLRNVISGRSGPVGTTYRDGYIKYDVNPANSYIINYPSILTSGSASAGTYYNFSLSREIANVSIVPTTAPSHPYVDDSSITIEQHTNNSATFVLPSTWKWPAKGLYLFSFQNNHVLFVINNIQQDKYYRFTGSIFIDGNWSDASFYCCLDSTNGDFIVFCSSHSLPFPIGPYGPEYVTAYLSLVSTIY